MTFCALSCHLSFTHYNPPTPPFLLSSQQQQQQRQDMLGCGKFQNTLLIASGLCFSADAMEITLLSFLSTVLKVQWNLSSSQAASITSSVFAGQLVGTIVLGRCGDVIGRKPIFLIASIIIAFFGILTAFASNFIQLVLLRTAVGFG